MKSDQDHVDKRILGGKGWQYEGSTSSTLVRPVTGVDLGFGESSLCLL